MDLRELVERTRTIWNDNADWWDNQRIDESPFTRLLIKPAVLRLLAPQEGESLLDLACGNGWFARDLAQRGSRLTACDFSSSFLACARTRQSTRSAVEYLQLDLTQESDLAELGSAQFDGAVCNMALMDIADIRPLLRTIRRVLKPSGRFVFSIPHPCFHTPSTMLVAERPDLSDKKHVRHSLSISGYFGLGPELCSVLQDQPRPHYLFHRPLTTLFSACIAAGLTLDGLEEPTFPPNLHLEHMIGWANLSTIPPILAARLRPTTRSHGPAVEPHG